MNENCDECKRPCDGCAVMPGALSELEQMRILGNGKSGAGYTLIHTIIKALWRARKLHPVFAEGKYQALGRINAEVGELARAIDKNEGTLREKQETIDSIVVLIRYWLDEWDTSEQEEASVEVRRES